MVGQEFEYAFTTISEEVSKANITGLFQGNQSTYCGIEKFWKVAQQTVPSFFILIKTPFIIPERIEMEFRIMELYEGRDRLPTSTCPQPLQDMCTSLQRSISDVIN